MKEATLEKFRKLSKAALSYAKAFSADDLVKKTGETSGPVGNFLGALHAKGYLAVTPTIPTGLRGGRTVFFYRVQDTVLKFTDPVAAMVKAVAQHATERIQRTTQERQSVRAGADDATRLIRAIDGRVKGATSTTLATIAGLRKARAAALVTTLEAVGMVTISNGKVYRALKWSQLVALAAMATATQLEASRVRQADGAVPPASHLPPALLLPPIRPVSEVNINTVFRENEALRKRIAELEPKAKEWDEANVSFKKLYGNRA